MSDTSTQFICPLCGTSQNSSGRDFSSLRAVSLHVAGKAKTCSDSHRSWVLRLLPGTVLRAVSVNQIADQIMYDVQKALEEDEEEDELTTDIEAVNFSTSLAATQEMIEKLKGDAEDPKLQRYTEAYEIIWKVETTLHEFVLTRLQDAHGELFLQKGLPAKIRDDCLAKAQQDGNEVPFHCYMGLLDLREIVKHNGEVFEQAFTRLAEEYKDPKAVFFSKVPKVNSIRNNVMHPLKRVVPTDEDMTALSDFESLVQRFTRA